MTSSTEPSVTSVRTAALVIALVDGVVLLLAAALAGLTYVELRDPAADPLTAIGYVLAVALAGLAGLSLLLVGLSRLASGAWRVACLVLAAVPLAPLAMWVGATWW